MSKVKNVFKSQFTCQCQSIGSGFLECFLEKDNEPGSIKGVMTG